ncbi:MAG: hypothetical protein LV480_04955 [Methylacidiphilales bacterium]|nr:hypothetical protein [Candidatus Methylacidiphilales bacterium]
MSDEFEPQPAPNHSSFWPLLLLALGLFIFFGYQDLTLYRQGDFYKHQVISAADTLKAANGWRNRYGSIIKDLNETGAKDTNAVPILQAAVQAGIQAGLLHFQQNGTNTDATPTQPTAAPSN